MTLHHDGEVLLGHEHDGLSLVIAQFGWAASWGPCIVTSKTRRVIIIIIIIIIIIMRSTSSVFSVFR